MQNQKRKFVWLIDRFFGGRAGLWLNRGGLTAVMVGIVFLATVYLHWFVTTLLGLAGAFVISRFIWQPIYFEWSEYHRKTDAEMNLEIVETFGAALVLFGLALLVYIPMWVLIAFCAGLTAAGLLVFCLGTLPAFLHMRKRIEESRKWF